MSIFLRLLVEVAFRLGAAFAIFRWGRKSKEIKALELENEDLKAIVGYDDEYLAMLLRERAKAKRDNDKPRG